MDKKQYEQYQETKQHTPSDFPYNTYLCTIPLDFDSVKLHWHEEAELIVIKKGEGKVGVDLIQYEVQAGDIVVVMPGQLHSIEQKNDIVMEYENILFKPSLLISSGVDKCGDGLIAELFSGERRVAPLMGGSFSTEARLLVERIDRLCDMRPYGYQLAVKGLLFQLVAGMLSEGGRSVSVANRRSLEKLKSILSYVEGHYSESISIADMAGICYYSSSYFMKFFKETMGVGFTQYLNDYRLEKAAQRLVSSEDNILEIASAHGFDNLSYFTRSFKKKYGITPGKYRRQDK